MKSFEYARPETEAEAVEFLGTNAGQTVVLAGGTDLVSLMKAELVTPSRVVDLKRIPSLREVTRIDGGVQIGSLATLSDLAQHPLLGGYRSLFDVIDGVRAIQIQGSGTIGGDLCHLPNCWYFRGGYGLLAMDKGVSLPEVGDNRYHAILGNSGPAKFVNASRFAPALIAWGAKVRVISKVDGQKSLSHNSQSSTPNLHEEWLPLEYFYISPKTNAQGNTVLKPGQLISHVWLPDAGNMTSATYEVLQTEGLDWPLASAGVCVDVEGGLVRQARIVMGHVAPTPWLANDAARLLIGQSLNDDTAGMVADAAVSQATPLSMNDYKVQLARTAVKRALLKSVGKLEM
ncbi:MAG: molybdopterin dehydrogenase [Planctomycetota bacterium]|nr:MAG: molybdopterin dehydrogenase [Planctomycetota bacterium]